MAQANAPAAVAGPETRYAIDVGLGHEDLSSPLIRVSPNGPLILVEGLNRLSGNYLRTVGSGLRDWPTGGDGHLTLSGRADLKKAPSAPDLDFGMASADLMWRAPVGGAIAGVGPSVQRLWVAGKPFRSASGVQVDLTVAKPSGGYWAWIAGAGANRHREEHRELDSHAVSLSGHRRIADPVSWLGGLDVEFGAGRERNANGFDDLSSRNLFGRVAVDRRIAGIDVSVGLMRQRARFDAALLEGLPARRDRFGFVDVAAVLELSPGRTLRLDLASGRNDSNLPMFENRYRQIALTLSFSR